MRLELKRVRPNRRGHRPGRRHQDSQTMQTQLSIAAPVVSERGRQAFCRLDPTVAGLDERDCAWRYSRDAISLVCGMGEAAKSSNGAEKIAASQSTVTAS